MVSLSVWSIAIGLAVMILTVAIVTGFKGEIRKKITGFSAHIQIVNFDNNNSYETQPISKTQLFYPRLKEFDNIRHIQTLRNQTSHD